MINSDNALKRVCKLYHLVENYIAARFDKENKWDLHHRREIDEGKSANELMDEGRYYDVEPEELIFLTKSEHTKLHNERRVFSEETRNKIRKAHQGKKFSEEHKQKLSKAHKGKMFSEEHKHNISETHKGENHPMFGKTHAEETRQKISKSCKNSTRHKEHIHKLHEAQIGKHWYTNGTENVRAYSCPEGFVPGRIYSRKN